MVEAVRTHTCRSAWSSCRNAAASRGTEPCRGGRNEEMASTTTDGALVVFLGWAAAAVIAPRLFFHGITGRIFQPQRYREASARTLHFVRLAGLIGALVAAGLLLAKTI